MAGIGNLYGMGRVAFPTGQAYGSGDFPFKVLDYSTYTGGAQPEGGYYREKKKSRMDKFIEKILKQIDDDKTEDVFEKSIMDNIKNSNKARDSNRQKSDYLKKINQEFKSWLTERRAKFEAELAEKGIRPEEKKLLETKFKLELIQKKRSLSEKRRNYMKKKNRKLKPTKYTGLEK